MAKQRVSQFKKIESQKLLKELKMNQENKKKQLEEEHKIELDTFNEEMDRKMMELNERYEEDQKSMIEQHDKEINAKTEEFNREYPQQPKGSTELLNQQKILEGLAKQKDYTKAHQIQLKINEMVKNEQEKWEKHKNEKLKKELDKIRVKQENEMQFFHKKMNLIFNEFKKNRAIETEKILQKYGNKSKGTDNAHKCELNEFHRPLRSALKNTPYRPNSTAKNTSGGFMNTVK